MGSKERSPAHHSTETGLDSRTVEGANLLFTPRVEAEMESGRRRSPVQSHSLAVIGPDDSMRAARRLAWASVPE